MPTMIRLAWLTLLAACAAAQAGPQSLLPAQAGDLVAGRAVAVDRTAPATLERAPLAFSQPLAAGTALAAAPAIHVAESRDYWQRVAAAELQQGYALALTAPGALILLSPTPAAAPLAAGQVRIARGAERVGLDRAGEALADAAALRAAGMDVAAGTVGFRLREGYEDGAALLVEGARGDYLLHVYEPRSRQVLTLATQRDTVHAGEEVSVTLALQGGARIDRAAGLLVGPDGTALDLDLAASGDTARGTLRIPVTTAARPGLWEVRTTVAAADGPRVFQRDARTAFAVSVPTARITGAGRGGDAKSATGAAPEIDIDLDVASAGRYEVRGILYATDADGGRVPAALAQSAAWLEPGPRRLRLTFPTVADRMQAPFELRDLRLNDQGVPALIERRARALVLDR